MAAVIRALSRQDCDALVRHVYLHAEESGRAGGPVFMPRSRGDRLDLDKLRFALVGGLATPFGEPGWIRAWGAFDGREIVGHVDLRARAEPAARHRAWLGVGVLAPHRRHGFGRALLREAIAWARTERSLSWIDLGVFSHNEVALRLYKELGFRETGRLADLFRIDGQSIEDVSMTLRLD